MGMFDAVFNHSTPEELGGVTLDGNYDLSKPLVDQATTWHDLNTIIQQTALPDLSSYFTDQGLAVPDDVSVHGTGYSIPGKPGYWDWDTTNDQGGWIQADPTRSVTGERYVANVLHPNEDDPGFHYWTLDKDISPSWWEKGIETVMPYAVGAITALAGGAALGGYMGWGGAAAGEAGGAAAGAAESAAPAFTYGVENPAWMNFSQGMGTELGTGFYGTDPGSMAGLFGTTADAGAGLGSGIGSGLAAEGGIWAGAGGGWPGLMAEAGGGYAGSSLLDTLGNANRVAQQAQRLYNMATGSPTQAVGGATGGASGGGGMLGAGGISQALSGGAGQRVDIPGMAQYTDMTSEIGQIPLGELLKPQLQPSNNSLPATQDNAMLGLLQLKP